MDSFNPARNERCREYLGRELALRTDLYSGPSSGTLLTHKESIRLLKKLGVKMAPELKSASITMPYDSDGDGVGDYTQEDYAQQMIDEYKAANVKPRECLGSVPRYPRYTLLDRQGAAIRQTVGLS